MSAGEKTSGRITGRSPHTPITNTNRDDMSSENDDAPKAYNAPSNCAR